MAIEVGKKLIENQPKFGDTSIYNYDVDTTSMQYMDFFGESIPIGWPTNIDIPGANTSVLYQESVSLPINYDKFQNKDLYTTSVGDRMNEKIIERNLKYEAENSITINNLYISNAGVHGTVKNNQVSIWIFSKEAYGGDPTRDGYSALKSKLGANPSWLIYNQGFGNKSEGSDLGSISSVENIPIISNFAGEADSIILESLEFPGGSGFNPLGNTGDFNEGGAFALNNIQQELETNLIINESVDNPIYVVIYTRGDKKVAWPIKTDSRKRKYSVYKISNKELFTLAGSAYTGKVVVFNFDSADSVRTGEGGGGTTASAWKVTQFQMTINTSTGIKNNFDDVEAYLDVIPEVLPPIPIIESSIFSFEFLSILNPKNQLYNDELTGQDMSVFDSNTAFVDYVVVPKISPVDINNELTDVDLQSYHSDLIKSFKGSAPSTISLRLAFLRKSFMLNNDGDENPNNFVFMEGPNTLLAPNPGYDIDNGWAQNPSWATNHYFYWVVDWDDNKNKIKTIDDYIQSKPENKKDYLEKTQDNLYIVKKVTQGYDTIPLHESDLILNHTYSTPGIKTIKIIVVSAKAVSGDAGEGSEYVSNTIRQFGRWKLVTCRFYLDIPNNEYPDFGELGGSDYTTIPWPSTSPVIGGVSENSKYKISVQDTLSGGKIGDTDIIDEKFLVNDLENDEMGKNINVMDLEQFRFFNKSYDMSTLLNIPIVDNNYVAPYYDISGSSTQISGSGYWSGNSFNRSFPEESSVGQIFISDNQDKELKENCKIEINTGNLTDKSIYDSSGNSNKGLLIGDYKVKKVRKGEPMRRDSFIKVPKKINDKNGAL